MSKRKITQKTSIFFLALGVFVFVISIDWASNLSVINLIILVLGTLGSIVSVFIPSSYSFKFSKADWKAAETSYELVISMQQHGMGRTTNVDVFQNLNDYYEFVLVGISFDIKGNVKLSAIEPFDGKVIMSA